MLVNTADYYAFDPKVHGDPLPTLVAVGEEVDTYDGPGVVLSVEPDTFYGQPPVERGEPVSGPWDGLAYRVRTAQGVTTFDRSRIRRK